MSKKEKKQKKESICRFDRIKTCLKATMTKDNLAGLVAVYMILDEDKPKPQEPN